MAEETVTRRSRRALLGVAAGVAAATVVSAVAKPLTAEGASDSASYTNNENANTIISAVSAQQAGFTESGKGTAVSGTSHSGSGVQGISGSAFGVYGQSDSNIGVYGYSDSTGQGVLGFAEHGNGVRGNTGGASAAGVIGHSYSDTTGVVGYSGSNPEPVTPAKTGVYGEAHQDATATGVFGFSGPGTGVYGASNSYVGVWGRSGASWGVYGTSYYGSAVEGYSLHGAGVRGDTKSLKTPAIVGHAYSGTTGVVGYSGPIKEPVFPLNTGVVGMANKNAGSVGVHGASRAGVGLLGTSTTGRGGQFSGGPAQLRLVPSTAVTHPQAGATGDLFLDNGARLWLCTKGGSTATWKRVALV